MPSFVPFIFIFTTLATIELFARARPSPMRVRLVLFAWIALQGAIAATGFYTYEMSVPPRIVMAIGPPLIALMLLFTTAAGRRFLDSLDLRRLTWMHTVRVPVELTLFWLFQAGLVPELMTFEGPTSTSSRDSRPRSPRSCSSRTAARAVARLSRGT